MTLHTATSDRRVSTGRTAGLRQASLAAAGLVVQAIRARHGGVIVTSVIGLLALIGAAAQGAAFVDQSHPAASMVMAILTGVALLCYGVSLYLLGSPGRQSA